MTRPTLNEHSYTIRDLAILFGKGRPEDKAYLRKIRRFIRALGVKVDDRVRPAIVYRTDLEQTEWWQSLSVQHRTSRVYGEP